MPEILSRAPSDGKLIAFGVVLFALAYPPFHLLVPSFVCLIPMVVVLRRRSAGDRFSRLIGPGFLFGSACAVALLHWIPIALWRFQPVTSLLFIPIVAWHGVVGAAVFAAAGGLMRRTGLAAFWILPPLWIGGEWLSGWLGSIRVSWLGLGTSLTGFPGLVQPADLIGAAGIGWLLVLANVALAEAWLAPNWRRRWLMGGSAGFGILASGIYGEVQHARLDTRTVGDAMTVQPNIGYLEKWNPALQDAMVAELARRSTIPPRSQTPIVIVWPEMAIPDYLDRRWGWERQILEVASRTEATLIIGGLSDTLAAGIHRHFNAALVARPRQPRVDPVYRKRFLVPLLESNPFRKPGGPRQGIFGTYSAGDSGVAVPTPLGRVGILICFESAFAGAAREDRRHGADILVNLSNDAWLGPTAGPHQNAAHLVMRAIENRIGIIRAANTGPSLIINPFGRITHRTHAGTSEVLTGRVITTSGTTVYDAVGDWLGLIGFGLTGILIAVRLRSRPVTS